jgi:hypothetical protein
LFKGTEDALRSFCWFLLPGNSYKIVSSTLNEDSFAQDRLRDLKWVSSAPPIYEDSEYVLNISL